MNDSLRQIGKQILFAWGNRPSNLRRLAGRATGYSRLHVGCGGYWVPGWLNIGILSNEALRYGTYKIVNGAGLMNYDVTRGLPVGAGTVDVVYSSHFIYYINFNQAREFFRGCFQAMKPGGIIRTASTDLENFARRYVDKDREYFERLHATGAPFPNLKTNGEIFMGQVVGWNGAQWCYDYESLAHILGDAGFVSIRRSSFRESRIPDIEKLEPDVAEKHLQTMYVEAEKPR